MESLKGFLETHKYEEQDYLEHMAEAFASGERDQKAE